MTNHDIYSGPMSTTEKLNMDNNIWESTTSLPEALFESAAVASKSEKFIGFIAGGLKKSNDGKYRSTEKIWGMKRKDLTWVEMPQKLKNTRNSHSMLNLASSEVPGC